jgi:DNA-binding NtrC family response regulator
LLYDITARRSGSSLHPAGKGFENRHRDAKAAKRERLILLTEDSELQSVILLAMSRDVFRLEEAGTIREMLEMEDGGGGDVVLLDLDSPGSEGIKGLRQIRRRWAEVPVLVATRDNSVEMGKQIVQEQVFLL